MVALNTTTSTLSITNLSSTPPVTISPISLNATKPTSNIVPSISGFKGAAGREEASMFALGDAWDLEFIEDEK
ncbi:hypothetical protein H2200_005984 [Cladophialophora chaetospira]|uniref:Uncharacterized protein n=1 Tax=Cladophialophora chaetospira TaxID=386627 RepID=A0AA38XA77_9EURO|nr:hypothetical protein H2200_005984 [Cladophialophora chaetospira]